MYIYIYTHYISSVCVYIYIYIYLHMYTVYTQKKKTALYGCMISGDSSVPRFQHVRSLRAKAPQALYIQCDASTFGGFQAVEVFHRDILS